MSDKIIPNANQVPVQKPEVPEYTPPIYPRYRGQLESLSNQQITRRNGGVRHQFIDDIGGSSSNYR